MFIPDKSSRSILGSGSNRNLLGANQNDNKFRRSTRDITLSTAFHPISQNNDVLLPNLTPHHSQRQVILKGKTSSFRLKVPIDNSNQVKSKIQLSKTQSRISTDRVEQAIRQKMDPLLNNENCQDTFNKYKKEFEMLEHIGNLNDIDTRKVKLHDFIYQKKLKNKIKYKSTALINHKTIPISRGSSSIMLNLDSKKATIYSKLDLHPNKDAVSQKSRMKLKWKTMENIILTKANIINHALKHMHEIYLEFGKGPKENFRLNKQRFHELLCFCDLTKKDDKKTTEKLIYSFFDQKQTNTVDYRELFASLIMLLPFDNESKVEQQINLSDISGKNFVTEKYQGGVFKSLVETIDEKYRIKHLICEILHEITPNKYQEFEKIAVIRLFKSHVFLKGLLSDISRSIKKLVKSIEEDLQDHFLNWIPLSNTMSKQKEGISFPLVGQVFDVIKANEKLLERKRKIKNAYVVEQHKDIPMYNDNQQIKVLFDDYDNYAEDFD